MKEMEQAGGKTDIILFSYCGILNSLKYAFENCPVYCSLSMFLTPPGSKEDTTTLHVLGLLKELMGTFPLGAVKSCCETLLRVMTLSHVVRAQKHA